MNTITRNRAYLVQPVRQIIVARDSTDAQNDAMKRWGPYPGAPLNVALLDRTNPVALTAPVHYTDAALRLDVSL